MRKPSIVDAPLRRRSVRRGPARKGLTFLELLIAMVIVVIVIVAILQLFDKDVEVRKQQDQMAELQQNLRAAMDLISRDVRGASACATFPSFYVDPLSATPPAAMAVPLPIAAVWMPSEGPLASTGPMCGNDDTTRPDGIAVMRCVGNGIVDIDTPTSFMPGSPISFKESMGLQDSDVGKFLLIWQDSGERVNPPINTPPYFTARIERIDPAATARQVVTKETVTLGVSIRPSGVDGASSADTSHATFGLHWCQASAWPSCTPDPEFNGEIKNFDRSTVPPGEWKAAMVEWVEYIVDKWDDNKVPHADSDVTKEGSCLHPLLVRRVNPHDEAGAIVPEWDVIGQDIEDLQVVWVWDPDGNPKGAPTLDPGTGMEYQAGDPSNRASFSLGAYSGYPGKAILGVNDLAVGAALYPQIPFLDRAATPVALRKVRVTLLGRTRDRDTSFGRGTSTGPSAGQGFNEIELGEGWLQGSAAIPGGPPSPPLYLSGYRRRALTSELTIRNYLPGGLE